MPLEEKCLRSIYLVKNKKVVKKKSFSFACFNKNLLDGKSLCIILIVLALVSFGCIMVYSASFYSAKHHYGNEYFFLFKQITGVILGLFGLCFFYFFDYHKLAKLKWWIVGASILLLILVFIPGIGVENYGAKRWVSILGFSIQPSEIAKFALVVFMASYMADNYNKIKTFKGLIPILAVAGVFCLLIMLEPSMSVTMCICFVTLFMLIIGGISKKHTLMFSVPASMAVPMLIVLEPYRLKRLIAFIDPWASPQGEGFQLIQSLYSLGSGGWFGAGLFNSRQKYLFLPFAESDFILSIIGEEIGYFGLLILLGLFLTLVILLIKIGLNASDRFGSLLACGVAFVIGVQTLLNVAVVTGSIPPTGLPLPFISAGSTSLLVFMSAIGVVLNIDRQSRKARI